MEIDTQSQQNVNFIPCVRWVKKGAANTNPVKLQLSKNELVQIINETKEKIQDTENNGDEPMEGETSTQDEFHLEKYDEDDNENTANVLGIGSLAELDNETEENFSESDDSDKEDEIIKPTDNLILVAHVEGDASLLEVYVYNEQEESLYVHHDIILPSFPLCLEYLNYEPKMPKGSYCAIGSMSPVIEIWDIDIMNVIEPSFTLGRLGSKKKKREPLGHTDAVLALAWNKTFDHILASGSVDQTILLWDMEIKKPSTTMKYFTDKVQCLEWHPLEAQTLLAGGCDSTARVFDCRSPETHQTCLLDGEAEKICWNPLEPFTFLAGTSKGSVQCYDCRKGLLWSISAHTKEVTGLSVSKQVQGLLITSSTDETVKIWDFNLESEPKLVNEKEFSMGNIHCLDLCPDLPFVITAGGDHKSHNFTVFDIRNIDVVKHTFEARGLIELVLDTNENSSA